MFVNQLYLRFNDLIFLWLLSLANKKCLITLKNQLCRRLSLSKKIFYGKQMLIKILI